MKTYDAIECFVFAHLYTMLIDVEQCLVWELAVILYFAFFELGKLYFQIFLKVLLIRTFYIGCEFKCCFLFR